MENSKWIMTFEARKAGAIGVPSIWTREIEAETLEAARLKLYDEFDHVHRLTAKLLPREPKPCQP